MTVCQTPRYLVHDDNFRDIANAAEFLDAGVSRKVYDLGDGTVLKVQKGYEGFAGGNLSEFAAWKNVANTPDAIFFAQVFGCADDGAWMVAEYVENVGHCNGDDRACLDEIGRRYGIRDLHYGNIGTRADGSPVIVDYAFNESVDSERESHGITTCCANGTLCTRHHGNQDCGDAWCNRCHELPCTDTDCERCHYECSAGCDLCHPEDDNSTWNPHREGCSACLAFLAEQANAAFLGDRQPAMLRRTNVHGKRETVLSAARGWRHFAIGHAAFAHGRTSDALRLF